MAQKSKQGKSGRYNSPQLIGISSSKLTTTRDPDPSCRTQDFTTPCWLGCFPHSVTTQAHNLDLNTSLLGTSHNHVLLGGEGFSLAAQTCKPLTNVHSCRTIQEKPLPATWHSEGVAIWRPPLQRSSGLLCPTFNCSILT